MGRRNMKRKTDNEFQNGYLSHANNLLAEVKILNVQSIANELTVTNAATRAKGKYKKEKINK